MLPSLFIFNFYSFYPIDEFERKRKTNYCIRFGHSLWSATQLPAQGARRRRRLVRRKIDKGLELSQAVF